MSDPAGNLVDKLDVFKEEKPVLYDAKGQPLQRVVGFRLRQNVPGKLSRCEGDREP